MRAFAWLVVGATIAGCSKPGATPQPTAPPSAKGVAGGITPAPSAESGTKLRPWFGGDSYEFSFKGEWLPSDGKVITVDAGVLTENYEWSTMDGEQLARQHAIHVSGDGTSLAERYVWFKPAPEREQRYLQNLPEDKEPRKVETKLDYQGGKPGPLISTGMKYTWELPSGDKGGVEYGEQSDVETPAGKFHCYLRTETFEQTDYKVVNTGPYCPEIGNWVKRTMETTWQGKTSTVEYELTKTSVDPAAPWPAIPAPDQAKSHR